MILIFLLIFLYGLYSKDEEKYKSEDFNIDVIVSDIDKDKDGIDDYTDILEGAKKEAYMKPHYKSKYYEGGYPPDSEGVCTDLIWRSLKNAGYNLKDLVDEDIKNNIKEYPSIENKADPNIDFRRVPTLKTFFERHSLVLTNDINKIEEWMPGDIVAFGSNHIGIISDYRNKNGIPYLIHNAGQKEFEENTLLDWDKKRGITGHYRWLYE